LEYWRYWPWFPEGLIRSQLRAAVADIRAVQGYLADMKEEAHDTDPHEVHLCRVAVKVSGQLGTLADQIDIELGGWRGEGGEP